MAIGWIVVGVAGLMGLASLGRKQKRKEALAGLRRHFPPIARMRLVAACPGLDAVLDEASLRLLFDWILIEMCRRTGSSGFSELMRWSLDRGEAAAADLTAQVTLDSVGKLPRPVLAVIDGCRGRTFAAVILDEALTEAGKKLSPGLKPLA